MKVEPNVPLQIKITKQTKPNKFQDIIEKMKSGDSIRFKTAREAHGFSLAVRYLNKKKLTKLLPITRKYEVCFGEFNHRVWTYEENEVKDIRQKISKSLSR